MQVICAFDAWHIDERVERVSFTIRGSSQTKMDKTGNSMKMYTEVSCLQYIYTGEASGVWVMLKKTVAYGYMYKMLCEIINNLVFTLLHDACSDL